MKRKGNNDVSKIVSVAFVKSFMNDAKSLRKIYSPDIPNRGGMFSVCDVDLAVGIMRKASSALISTWLLVPPPLLQQELHTIISGPPEIGFNTSQKIQDNTTFTILCHALASNKKRLHLVYPHAPF